MGGVIVALPKAEDGEKISGILKKQGIETGPVCKNAAEVLREAHENGADVVITIARLADMSYLELLDCLPRQTEMIVLSKNLVGMACPDRVIRIALPFKTSDLIGTVETILSAQYRRNKQGDKKPPARKQEEKKVIDKAKLLLMERNDMTEPEAYRYIQKNSMDTGRTLLETAEMILLFEN